MVDYPKCTNCDGALFPWERNTDDGVCGGCNEVKHYKKVGLI